jgi:hypothetical protein
VETWDHVQVNVEYLLARRLTIGQKQVDPLTLETAPVERGGYSLRDTKHSSARIFGKFGQAGCVFVRHHENVASVYGLSIHERRAPVTAPHHARGRSTHDDAAENTIIHAVAMVA